MPSIVKQAEFKITPEQFLEACSVNELKEVQLLIHSNRYLSRMDPKLAKQQRLQEDHDDIEAAGLNPEFFLGK